MLFSFQSKLTSMKKHGQWLERLHQARGQGRVLDGLPTDTWEGDLVGPFDHSDFIFNDSDISSKYFLFLSWALAGS